MLKEFKEFAMKGNLVDIAVAFVMGAAFNNVVKSFTGGIVSPLIGLIFDTDFKALKYVVKEGTANDAGEIVGEVAVLYGDFITNLLDFIIVAFVMFMLIVPQWWYPGVGRPIIVGRLIISQSWDQIRRFVARTKSMRA